MVANSLPKTAFYPVILREGEKGPIYVEAAWQRVWNKRNGLPNREEWLVVARRPGQRPETKYLLSNASARTDRMETLYAGLDRWTEEQCFEHGKDNLGLDEYQTKMWPGWYRHATLVILAHSFLSWLKVRGKKGHGSSDDSSVAGHNRACSSG
jgi:SRSO17 transposase